MPTRMPRGRRFALAAAGYEATVETTGAALCSLAHDGRDLVLPLAEGEPNPELRGALLAPWPNRLADGRYDFGGRTHRLPITEPETATAAHGLATGLEFDAVVVEADRAVLRARLEPRPGYPWWVALEVAFTLDARGLSQEVTARNEGLEPAPIGLGGHPYLLGGPARRGAIDAWSLELPATRVVTVDPERMLPLETLELGRPEAHRYDFRRARPLRGAVLNNAYTGFGHGHGPGQSNGSGSPARVAVVDAHGVGAAVEFDARCRWVQVYTADAATGEGHRRAVAVEPMTCPPDAFNSKRDLVSLAPGARTSAGWVISAVEPA